MTGSVFLTRLAAGLDFLPAQEQETVLRYYREKLSFADTISGEEELVKGFGTPEHICAKLREAMEQKKETPDTVVKVEEEDLTALPKAQADPARIVVQDEDLTDIPAPEAKEHEEASVDTPEDVIFHKPAVEEEGHELVQSIENRESFNLYGKKVEVKKEVSEIELPADEDDLTPEELEEAKQQALKKAAQFDEVPLEVLEGGAPRETAPEAEAVDPSEEASASNELGKTLYDPADDEEELKVTHAYTGLFGKLFPNAGDGTILALKILFSIFFSPVLVLAFGGIIVLYAVLTFALSIVSVVLFLLMVSFIIGGVVEIVFGITQLFSAVAAGLIEIGLGIVLFGIVTAVSALIYEFLFNIVPKAVKALTALCKKYLRLLAAVIYGGRA